MSKKFIMIVFVIAAIPLIFAHGENKAQRIIRERISCDKLSNEQFEILGDYYMEKMHPAESHGMMDRVMGENSERLKQMHIAIGRSIYCGDGYNNLSMEGGVMGMTNFWSYGGLMANAAIYWIVPWIFLIILMSLLLSCLLKASRSAGKYSEINLQEKINEKI